MTLLPKELEDLINESGWLGPDLGTQLLEPAPIESPGKTVIFYHEPAGAGLPLSAEGERREDIQLEVNGLAKTFAWITWRQTSNRITLCWRLSQPAYGILWIAFVSIHKDTMDKCLQAVNLGECNTSGLQQLALEGLNLRFDPTKDPFKFALYFEQGE